MEAATQPLRFRLALVLGLLACLFGTTAQAGNSRSRNFLVHAPTQQLADAVARSAEKFRRELAIHWLGAPLADWPTPCPIRVIAGPNLAAQGVTTYNPRPVSDFQMEVVGTPERILDSVLPHEVTHTILATHFGRPLPRWADEGICTTVEHAAERNKHEAKLREFLRSRRGIAMNQLFLMTEYPSDVLPMYAQGYSVCRFLIDQKGPREFIAFLQDYMRHPSWTANVKKHYGYDSLAELQQYWLAWVDSGSASVEKFAKHVTPATPKVAAVAAAAPAGRALTIPGSSSTVGMALNGPVVQPGNSSAGVAVASAVASLGWYERKRLEVQSQAKLPATTDPIAPPSVRNSGPYQTAHPQGEQQISRPGAVISRVFDESPASPRFR